MADLALLARSPLEGWRPDTLSTSHDGEAGVTMSIKPAATQFTVLARRDQAAVLAERIQGQGMTLPQLPRRSESRGVAVTWTAPGQWLVQCADADAESARRLFAAFPSLCSIVAADDQRVVVSVGGPRAADMLAKVVSIDLHARAFKAGDAAMTVAGGISVLVTRPGEARAFDCAVPRSFARSFVQWLAESAAEYGCVIEGTT